RPGKRIGRAHIEGADELLGLVPAAAAIDEQTARMGRIAVPSQREVFFGGERQAKSAPARVVGQVHDSAAPCRERRPRPTLLAVEAKGTRRGAEPGERFDELGLPVSFHSRNAEDLATCHREGRAAKAAAPLPPALQVDAFETWRPR